MAAPEKKAEAPAEKGPAKGKGLRVTASLVQYRDTNGKVAYAYEGDLLDSASVTKESREHLEELGFVESE